MNTNQENIRNKISESLSALRAEKGVTQEAVGAVIGVSDATISKWENGLSTPEAEYIPALADYYGVSADMIFGRHNPESTKKLSQNEYTKSSRSECVKKSFELSLSAISECRDTYTEIFHEKIAEPEPMENFLPDELYGKTFIGDANVYELFVNREDVNASVMLLGNKSNFSWMKERASEFIPLLGFLGDIDTIKILYFLYSKDCDEYFTADYAAEQSGISVEKASDILKIAAEMGLCTQSEILLKESLPEAYLSTGDGVILAIITFAYEYMCGGNVYNGAYSGTVKMIRSEK